MITHFKHDLISLLCKILYIHYLARPRVADRGDGLQVAADIVIKQLRTAESGWSSSLGVGQGLTTIPRKTQYLLESLRTASKQDGLLGTT
jgi:hypothetical protein